MSIHRSRNHQGGYLVATLGGAVVGIALVVLFIYLGVAYVKEFMPNAELEGLLPPIYGMLTGYWSGVVLGCWLGLRLGGYSNARRTAINVAWLVPLTLPLFFLISNVAGKISGWLPPSLEPFLGIALGIALLITLLIALPLLARFLVNRNQTYNRR